MPEYDALLAARSEWKGGFFIRAEASGLGVENLAFGSFYGPLDAPRIVGIELAARF